MAEKPIKYLLLLLVAFLCSEFTLAQQADTVVVYDYIYVTDTVWIQPKPECDTIILDQLQPIENATLLLDTTKMNAHLIIFSSRKSATIPINRILINEAYQQKLTSMKKITFLGLAFLALNTVKAQPEKIKFGIYDKVNLEQQMVHYKELDKIRPDGENTYSESFALTESRGFILSIPIGSNLTFTPTLNYSKKRALQKGRVKTCLSDGYCFDRYGSTATPKFHFIGTDLLLNYNFSNFRLKWLNVHAGIQIEGLVYKDNNISLDYAPYRELIISYNVGVGFDFLKRCNLKFEYSNNLNKFVSNNEISIKYQNISVGFGFYLF